jgi:hypothetical protein
MARDRHRHRRLKTLPGQSAPARRPARSVAAGEEDFPHLTGGVVDQHVARGGIGPPPASRRVERQAGQHRGGQDADLTGPTPSLRRGAARDRRVSIEDSLMRDGRKSCSVLFDGYKRHVLRDLDTGLIPAVGITPAKRRRPASPAASPPTSTLPG